MLEPVEGPDPLAPQKGQVEEKPHPARQGRGEVEEEKPGVPQKPVAQGVQEEDEGAGRDRLPHPAEGVKPAEEEGVHPPGEDGEPQGGEHLGAVGPVLQGEGAEEAEEEDHHEGGEAREEAAEKGQDQGQALKGAPEKAP